MSRFLIIGYGNPLRSDDGVGWHVARELANRFPKRDVDVVAVHQLMPEIAERVSQAGRVLFIDASREGEPGTLEFSVVQGNSTAGSSFHELPPPVLLKLAEKLYGHCPPAELLTIAGQNFETGDAMSGPVRAAIPLAVEKIEKLIVEG